ncbi:hypothetical protein GALMADRAFT_72820 [Galerina marginata CBS 339.88]|uniref:Uncharacterized protein n=1 Tax=Galerina marginata (strain CBS 339.88) TaxID=685588 RepID=A0A067T019_GALM3|nr:hypothetical protein GALMADRAFT_72820 [Galerina marginata CBS 339.88]
MLLPLAIFYLLQGFLNADAAPRFILLSRQQTPDLSESFPQECGCSASRSRQDIVWSCLVTIFACSWVSVHPNIPGPAKRRWMKSLHRVELMFWSIISPELIIFWASRQWLAARHLSQKFSNYGWTMTHGFYIQMGGFMLHDGETAIGVLSPEKLECLLEQNLIEMPKITEDEIKDRSKGDGLSKAIVIVQTTWFIVQCIARSARGFIVTQLELITLAFAALNAIMYVFWWNKPLDIDTTVPVYLMHPTPPQLPIPPPQIEMRPVDKISAATGSETDEFHVQHPHSDKHMIRQDISSGGDNESDNWTPTSDTPVPTRQAKRSAMFWDLALQAWCILSAAAAVVIVRRVHDIFNIFKKKNSIGEGKLRVNTFYVYDGDLIETRAGMGLVYGLPLITALFGAIHCAGWNFPFPTYIESIIWRVSSAFLTGVAVVVVPGIFVAQRFRPGESTSLVHFIFVGMTSLVHAMLPLYALARLALLVGALISLRDLPPAALAEVEWTLSIPHI